VLILRDLTHQGNRVDLLLITACYRQPTSVEGNRLGLGTLIV
jgi:hypothetical protein